MSITKQLGGDRLGAGGKMNVDLKTFSRSTHDLSKIWRNTQAPGTLVPFMKLLALPGDTFDIDLYANVLTLPTTGPLFGSFKLQMDVFKVPLRLYQAQLHNNELGIGMEMNKVKLPIFTLKANGDTYQMNYKNNDNHNPATTNINPSALLNYLGVKGLGTSSEEENDVLTRNFNAIPLLGYWDIYKNYYANKQEETGRFIVGASNTEPEPLISIASFPLKNLDEMREKLLQHPKTAPAIINEFWPEIGYQGLPYTEILENNNITVNGITQTRLKQRGVQHGLGLKTYQSDIFNNWLNYTTITNKINNATKIDTTDGGFSIDTLNLAKKVYDLLNRVAVSGGTYEDWLETVYTHEYVQRAETPTYEGGLSQEIEFQEVVSYSATDDDPLGTLGGRGNLNQNSKKGGKLIIKVDEPCYIMGIVSITPRIDYSQGNDWDMYSIKTMDDLHKPSLDGIGFQDLVTEQMACWSTGVGPSSTNLEQNVGRATAGKQPAWINYMTNYNTCHGNFAIEKNQMFMTLNRNYQGTADDTSIKDLTTYIDPTKYNYAFAQSDITAMNFWVQIAMDIQARRKISAKIIPNL